MLEIELCRICLADTIRMYPIEHTRYHEVFEWYTEDTMDMNEELPYSVCYLCNVVLNKLYNFLRHMIDTEIYLKETLRNNSKLTYESVEKLKRKMISKPHNLSKIWLRNSNYMALDAIKGHRPPRELRRYFENPPIMVEYHKPYEHMKLEDIPEEEEELEKINEDEPDETKEAETEEIKETEAEEIKEAKTEGIKEAVTVEMKEAETEENEHQQIPHEKKLKKQPDNTDNDSETTADQDEFPNDDDEIISTQKNLTLETTAEIENKLPNIPNMEIDDESYKEKNVGSEKSQSYFTNKQSETPDPIDSFLLCAKKYRPPEKFKTYKNIQAVRKNLAKNHKPYLEFIKERKGIDKEPQEKEEKTPGPVKYHNPYLQFIEERIETPQEKIPETSEQRVKTLPPGIHQNRNLQIIVHPVEETEPEQTPKQMEIDIKINTNTPLLKSSDPAVVQLEERYYNLCLESVKETPLKISTEPLVIEKLKPVSRGHIKQTNEHNVFKLMKPTIENKPAKIIVTSEPKKYINSYFDFVQDIEHGSIENTRKLVKISNEIPIPPKNTRKRNLKQTSSQKVVLAAPVQEKPPKIDTDGKISEYCYFDHQKKYRRASILKKTRRPHKNQLAQQLATKIKNRAAKIRKELLKFQKTDRNAVTVIEENTVTKLTRKGQPGISELQEENSPQQLPLKSKEYSDRLLTEIPVKLPQTNKKRRRVVDSKYTGIVSDEPKDQNQGDQDNDQATLKDQADQNLIDKNDGIILEDVNNQMWSDEEDNTMDSQVDRALKVLEESLKDEHVNPILRNEEDQQHMPNDKNSHTPTDNNGPSLHLKDFSITMEVDQADNNNPKDQDNPSLVVHNVFTLKEQASEYEDLIPKEQYDHIIMLANQDDQIMEDGHVAVKIESVDEEFRGSFEKEHEEENILSDDETFYNDDIMDPYSDNDDIIQDDDIKKEVEQNMQIDEEVSEYEPYLQERVSPYESPTQTEQDGLSNDNNPDIESNINDIQGLNEQEHYTIRSISQITSMATVQLERLPIGLIEKISKENSSGDENEKYSCKLCDFQTSVRKAFLRHRNVHDLYKQFVCDICQHRFLSEYHLSRHKVTHRAAYFCSYCDFKTTRKFTMDKHQRVHSDLCKQYMCNICRRRFLSEYHLSKHKVIHRATYFCSYCDFKTTRKFTMDKHKRVHIKVNQYPCLNGCQRTFRTMGHRSKHLCTKYFRKCDVCSKVFKSEGRYIRHLDKHDGAAIGYKCSVCYDSFDTKEEFTNHYKQHGPEDSGKRKYTCKWCDKSFTYRNSCTKHMKLHFSHKKCDKKVSNKAEAMYQTDDEVELHEEERREDDKLVCSLCPKLFDTESELGQHAVEHIL